MNLAFTAPIWLWQGKGSWHFITLPLETAQELKFYMPQRRTGWGSVRITVKIGETKWQTSLFPEKNTGSFLLPLKAQVREKEKLVVGQAVEVEVWLDI